MGTLEGKVALVTGGSRGIGKGIALALAAAGATVYITGRTRTEGSGAVPVGGSVERTVAEAAAGGGRVTGIVCDHVDDEQSEAAVQQVLDEQGRLDVLVNNAWAGYEGYATGAAEAPDTPFWEKSLSWWDINLAGPRWSYVVTRAAAPAMVESGRGLVVTVSFDCDPGDPAYGAAKTVSNRLVREWQAALGPYGVTSVGLHPGLVRTEIVQLNAQYFDMSSAESPIHVGNTVAALAGDPDPAEHAGKCVTVAELARVYTLVDPHPGAVSLTPDEPGYDTSVGGVGERSAGGADVVE
ncbi:SDR family NAD(P)-dependent oxidoreductase [Microlunatus ginsengisoli]|uniref:SDR family NAD(P)-dependent oxidoreductase n=1 Tax=Microlunatus ginsengisoli TaxID=363863 RepID=A0ABP7AYY3_9ACTN